MRRWSVVLTPNWLESLRQPGRESISSSQGNAARVQGRWVRLVKTLWTPRGVSVLCGESPVAGSRPTAALGRPLLAYAVCHRPVHARRRRDSTDSDKTGKRISARPSPSFDGGSYVGLAATLTVAHRFAGAADASPTGQERGTRRVTRRDPDRVAGAPVPATALGCGATPGSPICAGRSSTAFGPLCDLVLHDLSPGSTGSQTLGWGRSLSAQRAAPAGQPSGFAPDAATYLWQGSPARRLLYLCQSARVRGAHAGLLRMTGRLPAVARPRSGEGPAPAAGLDGSAGLLQQPGSDTSPTCRPFERPAGSMDVTRRLGGRRPAAQLLRQPPMAASAGTNYAAMIPVPGQGDSSSTPSSRSRSGGATGTDRPPFPAVARPGSKSCRGAGDRAVGGPRRGLLIASGVARCRSPADMRAAPVGGARGQARSTGLDIRDGLAR